MASPPKQPLISVVMPAYNAGRFIAEAIESVLNQSWQNLELIVCDDASSDNTEEIVTQWMAQDTRVRYLKLHKIGHPAGVRNVGLKEANGEFTAFLDADDAYFPNALEALAGALLQNPKWHSARGFLKKMDEQGAPLNDYYKLSTGPDGQLEVPITYRPNMERLVLSQNVLSVLQALMIRRKTLDTVGYLNESLTANEDYEFYVRLYLLDFDGFGIIPEYIYNYRVYAASLTQDKKRIMNNIESSLKITDWLFAHPALPEYCQRLKGAAYGRRYQLFARYQLINGNKNEAREIIQQAWQNPNVCRKFFLKKLLPLHLRSCLPTSFNQFARNLKNSLQNLRTLQKQPQFLVR